MTKTLAGIAAQGAMLSKQISKMTFMENTLQYEESKLHPLTIKSDSGFTYEGGLSSSSLLPPSATHTKNTYNHIPYDYVMDGSQLLTDRTHLKEKLVSGVSNSKMRDVSQKHPATAFKKGLMAKKDEDDQK